MEMFLMALCLSMLGVAATAVAFAAATREEQRAGEADPDLKTLKPAGPPRFFIHEAAASTDTVARVPVEALLLQLERHIRLERVAAQSFLDCPTAESLHTRTESPLIH